MELNWSYLVHSLQNGYSSVIDSILRLLEFFVTPFGNLISADTGFSVWVTNLISWALDFFNIDFLELTPLQFMLGSTIPIIIVFTVYRYVKQ